MSVLRIARSPEIDQEPVSLTEFLVHQRLDSSPLPDQSELDDIQSKLTAARVYCENDLGRALITSRWQLRLTSWPCGEYAELLGNTQRINSVTYTDSDGAEHTFTDYKLVRAYSSGTSDAGRGRLYLAYGKCWPSAILDVGEPICIDLDCGWLTAADVPLTIKAAIKLLAGHLCEHREAVVIGQNVTIESKRLEMAVDDLLTPYRMMRAA